MGDPLPVSKLEESGRFASLGPSGPGGERRACYRCGNASHTAQDCRFREAVCHKCKKRGHLARVCRGSSSSYRSNRRPTRWVDSEVTTADKRSLSPDPDDMLGNVYAVGCSRVSPYKVTLELEGQPVTMEVDTGAAVSIISKKTHASLFPRAPLHTPKVQLRTYTSDPIHVVGQMTVEVKYQDYTGQHDLYVVAGNGPSLIGRDWLTHIRLDWGSIKSVARSDANLEVVKLTEKYASVFQAGPGLMNQFSACLTLKADARSRFYRPRSVPYATTWEDP